MLFRSKERLRSIGALTTQYDGAMTEVGKLAKAGQSGASDADKAKRDQLVSQADAFGHIFAKDRASPFERLGHGTYPQLAIVHIDENGVTRGDPELTAHGRRDHELTTVHNLDPLCFHLH